MREVELAIVGGGVAGRAAARVASSLGVETLLLDERPVPSAWMTWQIPLWYGERLGWVPTAHVRIARLDSENNELAELADRGVEVLRHTACWGAFDGRVLGLYDHSASTSELVRARSLILATGAGDVGLAFPGWTKPGVLGGLAALDLLASTGSIGGRQVVILGSGALALACAMAALQAGHEVVGLVEVGPRVVGDNAAARSLAGRGVEIITGHAVREALGDDAVERIVLGPTSGKAGARGLRADTLVVAVASAPNIELAYLLGCRFGFSSGLGGYVPLRTSALETTVEGVYVVGDAGGVGPTGNFAAAIEQGEVAARLAANALKQDSDRTIAEVVDSAGKDEYGGHFSTWHRACVPLVYATVVCRCESTSAASLFSASDVSGEQIGDEAKRLSRAGAGVCQGRCCRHTVHGLLAARHGLRFADMPIPSFRPPVRPVPMSVIGSGEPAEPPLREPFARLLAAYDAELDADRLSRDSWQAILHKVREENAFAIRDALNEIETEAAARALDVSLRMFAPH